MAVNTYDENMAKLADADTNARMQACATLASMGQEAEGSLEMLLHVLSNDEKMAVRRSACGALAAVTKGTKTATKAIAALDKLLGDQDGPLRAAAADGLGDLAAEGSVKKLAGLLGDDFMLVRSSAICALGKVGEPAATFAKEVRPHLDQPLLRAVAAGALGRLGPDAADFASDLVDCLEDSDVGVRWSSAVALGEMAAHINDSDVEQVAGLLLHSDGRIRSSAAAALGFIGPEKAGQHTVSIARLLRDEFSPERNYSDFPSSVLKPCCMAALALGKLGEKQSELTALLADKRADMRGAACEGLGFMLASGVSVGAGSLAKMRSLLSDESAGVRAIAEESLKHATADEG